ncbi:uncharacterized protein TNCV_4454641 [Trichonephila clavipes]|nr:uncharacterized protein TNCV_4454641 [Trichonephila clavipes]
MTKSDRGPHEIHRGKELDVRLSSALALSTMQVIVRFSSVRFLKEGRNVARACETQVGLLYDRWRHHRSPPPQFRHGTGGEGSVLQPPALVVSAATAQKTCGPTDLTSTYSVCTQRVIWWHRTSNPGLMVWSPML